MVKPQDDVHWFCRDTTITVLSLGLLRRARADNVLSYDLVELVDWF